MHKEILRLAIPNIISNISVPLLSTVDVVIMGRLSGLHIGAVGIGAMLFSFLFWNFGFLRMGTTGMTAQAYGKKQDPDLRLLLQRSIFVALVIGLLLVLLSGPFFAIGAELMQVSDNQYDMVRTYFRIGMIAAPATLILFAMKGWFFGMQNAIIPLILTIVVNVVNILLSYWFVIHLGWEIEGVAWGTVIAQYCGMGLALILLIHQYKHYAGLVNLSEVLKWQALKVFFRINSNIFVRTLCLSFTFAFFYSRSSTMGETLLAANVILLQLLNWMSYGIDGFAYAAESLVGKYYGASDALGLKKAISLSLLWGLMLALLYSILYGSGAAWILYLFTTEKAVIAEALLYFTWMIILPLAGFGSYIWDGIFIGITASVAMRNTMLLSLGVFLIVYLLGNQWLAPNHALWLSLLMFLFCRGIFQWNWYRIHKDKLLVEL